MMLAALLVLLTNLITALRDDYRRLVATARRERGQRTVVARINDYGCK